MNEVKMVGQKDEWLQIYRMFGNEMVEGERLPVFLTDKEGNKHYLAWNPQTNEVRTRPFDEKMAYEINASDSADWEIIGNIPESEKSKATCMPDLENAIIKFAREWILERFVPDVSEQRP